MFRSKNILSKQKASVKGNYKFNEKDINMKLAISISFLYLSFVFTAASQSLNNRVSKDNMQAIYDEVKTPYKYGLVMVPDSNKKKWIVQLYSEKAGNGL